MESRFPANWREILAKNIRLERVRIKLIQEELASRINLKDGATISQWERGSGRFNVDILDALCRVFDRTPYEMMYIDLTNAPPPNDKIKKSPLSKVAERERERQPEYENEAIGEGASMATESPPVSQAKSEPPDIKEMRQKMLEMMMQLESMTTG